ncbi:chromate efflux transporter [Niabella ginsengisoli]|uniref:Chromate efflux transporter n=1 Tax=Niabella ginsengisoli TaxID=522298 RepID=A0ABS9SKF7_9BACT|nr:chromate efflux transporter [Niabella ginsengisoli]MCH5598872.1 chromate efflux transporter [Niabella ginsengisoli]
MKSIQNSNNLKEIAVCCLKLGCIGFGGIAGMVSTIEAEIVNRRKWIDQQHFMDVVSTSYIIPGPNAVEVVMHCGKERGGRLGLIVAGICYILPAMLICVCLGFFYKKYASLPNVQAFLFGLRPATTALIIATVIRLSNNILKGNIFLIFICCIVFIGSYLGYNEVLLILGAGMLNYLIQSSKGKINIYSGFLFYPLLLQISNKFPNEKLFFIFLKIGVVLYGSGYVLFAYMEESLIRRNHWLTHQQLVDAIAVGQITPGPILSSATFAGFLINGYSGAIIATTGIFLPSFLFPFFYIIYFLRQEKAADYVFFRWVKCCINFYYCSSWHSFGRPSNRNLAKCCFIGKLFSIYSFYKKSKCFIHNYSGKSGRIFFTKDII